MIDWSEREGQQAGNAKELFMSDQTSGAEGVLARIAGVIDQIRPMLQSHGGDIELLGFDEQTGIVSVQLQGACQGCPGAAMTLRMGVERRLKEHVPEVQEVRAV